MDAAVLSETPGWVVAIVDSPAVRVAARVLLTSAYWVSGLTKLLNFKGALAEEASFHLRPPALFAGITIFVQLVGSALVIADYMLWLGAGMLAVFTLAAMIVAYPFWRVAPAQRMMTFTSFCEHLGLIAGFMLATLVSTLPVGR